MQFRWIAIGVMCFSAALLSACGGATGNATLSSRSSASAMSKSEGRHDASRSDKDDCDESEDHDKSDDRSSNSSSLTVTSRSYSSDKSSKDDGDDKDECKSSDDDHDKSMDRSSSSTSLMLSSKSSRDDRDGDDDATCKVTICHIPPGNHCNEHKIRVGKSAVRAHIEHGDYLGACDPKDPPPPAPPGPTCDPLACPQDPNGMATCDAVTGACAITCIPPTVWNGTLCNTPA